EEDVLGSDRGERGALEVEAALDRPNEQDVAAPVDRDGITAVTNVAEVRAVPLRPQVLTGGIELGHENVAPGRIQQRATAEVDVAGEIPCHDHVAAPVDRNALTPVAVYALPEPLRPEIPSHRRI